MLKDPMSVEPLSNVLYDENMHIRYIAAGALKKIGTLEALEALKHYEK